ncbi:MAG TPA: APC family permease [Polyangiaceae bacterium]|nr:APC family permease [Polyangiaceae bacterium]
MRRALSIFDATCLGVNAVVGSGIYLFPGKLARELGPASLLAWIGTGALCLPLALTFAALGRLEERTGGSFRYAELAFGKGVAFVVGWSAWVTSVISWAAVANGITSYLSTFAAAFGERPFDRLLPALVVGALGGLNVRGVKPGARVMDALTLLKLVPLAFFVAAGITKFRAATLVPFAPHGFGALPAMALMTLFAYQGFEVVGVPSGEVRDARRAVPLAVLVALAFPALLYVLVELVFLGASGPTDTRAPLVDAARALAGGAGATLLGLGGLVSMLGYNAGTALATPRYLQALADERLLPRAFGAVHPRYGTPAVAVVASAGVTLVLTQLLDFERLVDLAALAVVAQYLASSAALVKLGRGGARVTGLLSVLVSLLFAAEGELTQATILGALTLVGVVLALVTRRLAW